MKLFFSIWWIPQTFYSVCHIQFPAVSFYSFCMIFHTQFNLIFLCSRQFLSSPKAVKYAFLVSTSIFISMFDRTHWQYKLACLWLMLTGGFPSQRASNANNLSIMHGVDSRLAPGQWETSLRSNAVSHWLGANLESDPMQHVHVFQVWWWAGTSGACWLITMAVVQYSSAPSSWAPSAQSSPPSVSWSHGSSFGVSGRGSGNWHIRPRAKLLTFCRRYNFNCISLNGDVWRLISSRCASQCPVDSHNWFMQWHFPHHVTSHILHQRWQSLNGLTWKWKGIIYHNYFYVHTKWYQQRMHKTLDTWCIFTHRSGGSLPVVFTYFAEFQSAERRGTMVCILAAFWMCGNILSAGKQANSTRTGHTYTFHRKTFLVLVFLSRRFCL